MICIQLKVNTLRDLAFDDIQLKVTEAWSQSSFPVLAVGECRYLSELSQA